MKITLKTPLFLMAFASSVMTGCTSVKVESQLEDEAIVQLSHYSWNKDQVSALAPLFYETVKSSVQQALTDKGYTLAPSQKGQFTVDVSLVADRDVVVDRQAQVDPYQPGFNCKRGSGCESTNKIHAHIDQSTRIIGNGYLHIKLIDTSDQHVLWQSTASKKIDLPVPADMDRPVIDFSKVESEVETVIAKMFKDLPYKQN